MSANADFVFKRIYRGKVSALILDWSGTTADAYVIAPAVVFVEVFKNQGVEISMEEARKHKVPVFLNFEHGHKDPDLLKKYSGLVTVCQAEIGRAHV